MQHWRNSARRMRRVGRQWVEWRAYMKLITRYSPVLAILTATVIVAAGCGSGHGERLEYGGSEFFYTSALLDDEAKEIGDFIFEGGGNDLPGSISLQADKNGVRVQTGSGARQWHFTYIFRFVLDGAQSVGSETSNSLEQLTNGLFENVLGEETREIKRITEMYVCQKKFAECDLVVSSGAG